MMKDEVTSSMQQHREYRERLMMSCVRTASLKNCVFKRGSKVVPYAVAACSMQFLPPCQSFNQLMYSITGPKLPFYQMNIIDLNGHRVTFGQEYNYADLSEEQLGSISWLQKVVDKDGKLYIEATHDSEINSYPVQVISLCRGFGQLIGGRIGGVVEIQISYDTLDTLIKSTAYLEEEKNTDKAVVVLDQEGRLIYPLLLEEEMLFHYRNAAKQLERQGNGSAQLKNPLTGQTEFIFESVSDFSEWKVMLIMPQSILLQPISKMIWQIIFLGVLFLIGCGVFSIYMSRIYTVPINKLYHSVQSLTLQNLNVDNQLQINSGVNELEQLNEVFNMMVIRLHESLEEAVVSKNMEMHSRMLALQAQMNPHFLYNTLTVISIMAENQEKENVRWACRNLSICSLIFQVKHWIQ
ncbi:MAG: sensor histidine kinase [Eisenbergiella massiliensis]